MMKTILCMSMLAMASAGIAETVLIDDDFSASTMTASARIYLTHAADGSGDDWIKGSKVTSDWAISGGAMGSPASTMNDPVSEGVIGQLYTVATTDTSLTRIKISFDYTVGVGSTLRFFANGLATNGAPAANEALYNTGVGNVNPQDAVDNNFADVSLLTREDPGSGASAAIAFPGGETGVSGTYSRLIDLADISWSEDEAPGVSGSLTSITDLDYIAFMFGNDVTVTDGTGAVSIDNFKVTAVSAPIRNTFMAFGNTYVDFPDLEIASMMESINKEVEDVGIEFVIIVGELTRSASVDEFEAIKYIMDYSPVPVYVSGSNHDLVGNAWNGNHDHYARFKSILNVETEYAVSKGRSHFVFRTQSETAGYNYVNDELARIEDEPYDFVYIIAESPQSEIDRSVKPFIGITGGNGAGAKALTISGPVGIFNPQEHKDREDEDDYFIVNENDGYILLDSYVNRNLFESWEVKVDRSAGTLSLDPYEYPTPPPPIADSIVNTVTGYDSDILPSVSNNDLAQTHYLSSSATGGNQATEHAQLFNGLIGNTDSSTDDAGEVSMNSGNTFTVELDTSVNTKGYTITGIDSYFGWNPAAGGRSNQGYEILLTFVDNTTATLVGPEHWAPNSPEASYWTKVSFSEASGESMAWGVKAITFDITEDANAAGIVVAREFDVFGAPTTSLQAHWKLDDGSGDSVSDHSGKGFHGTALSGSWVDGIDGGAFAFDGSSTEVNLPAAAFNAINDEITLALWIDGSASGPATDSVFFAIDESSNRVLNVHLPFHNSTVYWDAGDSSGYDRISKVASPSEFMGGWSHWVFTKNASTGEMNIYLNGSLWHTGADNFRTMSGIVTARLGSQIADYIYEGTIDDVRLYNQALSAQEVATLFETYRISGIPVDWLSTYGLSITDSVASDNPDGDTLVNFAEYALGGMPTDATNTGHPVSIETLQDGETNWFEVVYQRRIGSAEELSYSLETSTTLLPDSWTLGTYVEVSVDETSDANFESVTNRIEASGDSHEFIRLKIDSK